MLYLQAVKLSTDWMIFSMVHFENEGVHCCTSALTLCLRLSLSFFAASQCSQHKPEGEI